MKPTTVGGTTYADDEIFLASRINVHMLLNFKTVDFYEHIQ